MKFIFLLLILTIFSCTTKEAVLSLDNLRKIADEEVSRKGFQYSDSLVSIDLEMNSPEAKLLLNMIENNESLKSKLRNKKYVLVYYQPIQKPEHLILGGEYYVFIESSTGKVLLSFPGK